MLDQIDAQCIKDLKKIGYTWNEIMLAYGSRFSLSQLKYAARKLK